MGKIALAIHGGAGTILKSQMTPDLEREYRGGLEAALATGWKILEKALEGREHHEQVGGSVALILVVDARRPPRFHRNRGDPQSAARVALGEAGA